MEKYFGELFGTFALVFCGTGAIITNELTGGTVTHVGIALTFGLIVMVMVYALGEVSGAHLNPAVTIGFWALRRFPVRDVPFYIGSQIAGALIASGFLKILFPASVALGATFPQGTALQSFVLEMILTFLLMMVIIRVSEGAKETKWFAGIAVGGTVLLEALFAGPVCGASMNPARSLAPAIVSGHLEYVWIYLIAPTIGALLATFAGRLLSVKQVSFSN